MNSEYGPNTEYWIYIFVFENLMNTKYQIISFFENRPNTEYQIFEYQILNNEYWKLTEAQCH